MRNVSEVPLSEVLDTICQMWSPVKITYNDKVLYNDFDADSGVEIREGEFYGETRAPQLVVKERAFGLLNKIVHSIVIDYVDFHHTIITIKGEH